LMSPPPGWAMLPALRVPAGTKDLTLRLVPADAVAGRVVDASRQGVKARVYAANAGMLPPLLQETDAEGRFRIEVSPDFLGQVGAMGYDDTAVSGRLTGVRAGQTELVVVIAARPASDPATSRR
jgi:hypothetical protein